MNRGGLLHISDPFFQILCLMDLVIRGNIGASSSAVFNKRKISKVIVESPDVHFNWTLVSADVEEEDASIIFDAVVEKLLTIRGFSFASSIMEQYKQECKESTQKSKALRKKLS